MAVPTVPQLLDWLARNEFVRGEQAAELRGKLASYPDGHALAKELLRRDWLTPYQANQILKGQGDQLVFGCNRLLQRLGEGSMGQVFKAFNTRLQRVVALKTIHKGLVESRKAMERFRREMQTTAQLDHPNIALLRDADEDAGRPFLVMDYIAGTDLAQRVKRDGPLPIAEAVGYARQAALGLQHAFERGVVHRDIKPGNLMIEETGNRVKILDFGLARFDSERSDSARLTQANTTLGTIDYIAPEQAQSASRADIRSDIYSLGCTLFYLLTGEPPFQGETASDKLAARMLAEPPSVRSLRGEIPEAFDAVLLRMMARHPDDRYQTPAEAAAALQPFAASSPSFNEAIPLAQPVSSAGAAASFAFVDERPAEPFATSPTESEQAWQPPHPSTPQNLGTPRAAAGSGMNRQRPVLALVGAGVVAATVFIVGIFWALSFFRGDSVPRKGYFNAGAALQITEALISSGELKPGETKLVIVRIRRTEFKGPVEVRLEGVPREKGVSAETSITIPTAQNAGQLRITASFGIEPLEAELRVLAAAENLKDERTLKLRVAEPGK